MGRLLTPTKGPNMGPQDRKTYRGCAKRTHKMDHVFVLGTDTHVGDRLFLSPPQREVLTFITEIQKPFGTSVGIFLQRWYRQGMGDRHAASGVYFGWTYCKCECGAMGRWRIEWQGRTIHRFVGSDGAHLGCEWGTFLPETPRYLLNGSNLFAFRASRSTR